MGARRWGSTPYPARRGRRLDRAWQARLQCRKLLVRVGWVHAFMVGVTIVRMRDQGNGKQAGRPETDSG